MLFLSITCLLFLLSFFIVRLLYIARAKQSLHFVLYNFVNNVYSKYTLLILLLLMYNMYNKKNVQYVRPIKFSNLECASHGFIY